MQNNKVNSEEIQIFEFKGFDVRIVDDKGNPWFVARDVGKVIGLSRTAVVKITNKLKDIHKGVISIHTNRGPRETTIISEQGLYKMLMRSRKTEAEAFQDWIAEEVLPSIRKTGSYSSKKPRTRLQALQAVVQELVEQEGRLSQLEDKFEDMQEEIEWNSSRSRLNKRSLALLEESLSTLGKQVEAINKNLETKRIKDEMVEEQLAYLDKPIAEVKEKSLRTQINQIVEMYALTNELEFGAIWETLYKEFGARERVRIGVRAENRGMSNLDYVETEEGWMDKLYALATRMYITDAQHNVGAVKKTEKIRKIRKAREAAKKAAEEGGE